MKSNQDSIAVDTDVSDIQKKADEYLLGWQRALADYDNLQKATDHRIEDLKRYQIIEITHDLLPLIDMFDQALEHVPEQSKKEAWYQGLVNIRKQWNKTMEGYGVKQIESIGRQFDPSIHEAIHTVEDAEAESNTITSVSSHGYMLNDELIRPAQVTVNKLSNNK